LLGVESQEIKSAYIAFNKPITSISFSDDQLMSAENINSLHSFFGNSIANMHRISPENVNGKSIGHFGFIKRRV
jgi:predicted alpha/beta hydrolase